VKFPFFEDYIKTSESIDTEAVRFDIWREWIKNSYKINENSQPSGPDPVRAKVAAMPNEEAIAKAEKIMQMAKIKILNYFEWFKPYLDIMPPISRIGAGSVGPDGIGTMSTSGSAIYYCPKFVLLTYENAKKDFKMSEEEKKKGPLKSNMDGTKWYSDYACFVILHEIMHNSLKHFLRQGKVESDLISQGEIHRLWNIAMDYEINRILKNELTASITMFPGGVDLEEGPFEVPEDEKDFFRTQTCETIFWRMFDQLEAERRQEQEEGDEDEGDSDQQGEGDGEGSSGSGQQEVSLSPGDIIQDNETGEYGIVRQATDEDVEWDPISKEEALNRLYPDQNQASFNIDQTEIDNLIKDLDL
jgi:hypothetical protein